MTEYYYKSLEKWTKEKLIHLVENKSPFLKKDAQYVKFKTYKYERSISLLRDSTIIPQFAVGKHLVINEESNIVGLNQYNWKSLLKMKIFDELNLVTEPNNEYDNTAIAVYYKKSKIGYIPINFKRKLELFDLLSHDDLVFCYITRVDITTGELYDGTSYFTIDDFEVDDFDMDITTLIVSYK
ncbi:MAG: HIRAN domain-containing protein [Bacilli bacterium]